MRKITYFILSFLLLAQLSHSQGEIEALKYSRNELFGTARAMAMGNAFGALGGDITGVAINPAGIGVYRSSEIVGTLGYMQNNSKAGDVKSNVGEFNLHNFGFVGYFPLRNESMPMINFGFTHNRQKTFKRDISAGGFGQSTLIDYIADRSYGINPDLLKMGKDLPDPFLDQPWLSVLGYNSWLIYPHEGGDKGYYYTPLDTKGEEAYQQIRSYERGYIDHYDFTIGTTVNNVLNLGLSINIVDIYHNLSSDFLEDFDNGRYTLENDIRTNGAGVGAKFGLIYRPVNAFRIGLAYHTPMRYSMTELYYATIDYDLGKYVTDSNYKKDRTSSPKFTNYYDLQTPDKWVLSAAAVLGNNFIVSADYELTDYGKMKLKVPSGNSNKGWYDIDNEYIRSDFKMASNLRLGMEYRFTPQLSGRLGYSWMGSPYKADFGGDAAISGSNTIFRVEGDTNYYTGGFGFRFSREFYADFALVYQVQNDQLYPFPNLYQYNGSDRGDLVIDAAPFDLKVSSLRGLLTFGYRF